MTDTVLHVPGGSSLRPEASINQLRVAVFRALKAQMTTGENWRELLMLTGTDTVYREDTAMPWQNWLLGALGNMNEHGEADQYEAMVQEFVPTLLGLAEEPRDDGLHIWLGRLPAVEEALKLPAWLAYNEPDMHARLYAPDVPAAQMDLDTLLSTMDTVAANVERLQAIWGRVHPLLPGGPSGVSAGEYDNLVRRGMTCSEACCRSTAGPSPARSPAWTRSA